MKNEPTSEDYQDWKPNLNEIPGKKKKRGRPRHGKYLNTGMLYYLCVSDLTKQMVHDLAGELTENEYLCSLLTPMWKEYLKGLPPSIPDYAEFVQYHGAVCEWVDCTDLATKVSNDEVPLCQEHYDTLCDEWSNMDPS